MKRMAVDVLNEPGKCNCGEFWIYDFGFAIGWGFRPRQAAGARLGHRAHWRPQVHKTFSPAIQPVKI
jgi:hypothetical protein